MHKSSLPQIVSCHRTGCQVREHQGSAHPTDTAAMHVQRALFLHANELKPARDWLLERFGPPTGPSRGLGASLGGNNDSPADSPRGSPVRQHAPRGYEFRPDPSTPTSAGPPLHHVHGTRCCMGHGAHERLDSDAKRIDWGVELF